MLETMRRGAQTWVAKLLFGILVVSFGIWGIQGAFRGYGAGSLATVGSTHISVEEFQRAYQNELDQFSREAKKRITADQGRALGLDRRVLSQLIGGAAIENHAKQLGLGVSDKTLVESIQADPDFKGPDGKFSQQFFNGLLRQVGLSEQGFLNLRRKDELRTQVIGAFVKGLVVPKPMLETLYAYGEEKRTFDYQTIDADKMVTVAEPDDVKLKELYDASTAKYMTPEYRKFQVLSLTLDDLKKQEQVSDEEITAAYEKTKDSYDTPEQRRIQQIAFKDKAAAEAARTALASGSKTFGDVAKEAGAKDSDVDLGLINMKALIDPKIAKVAFSLDKDKYSDVVEGTFATVILRVTQIEPGITRTLADVKDQVRDKIATEKAKGEFQKKRDEVDDNRLAGKTLKEIADASKLSFTEVAAADRKGLGPDGKPALASPDYAKIAARAFVSDTTSDDEAVDLADGGYAWVNMLSKDDPKQRPFEEVKGEVKAQFMANERMRLVGELANKLVERLNAGEAMSAIEAASGGKTETTAPVTRTTVPQGLTENAVLQGFNLAKGKASSVETSDRGSRIVFRVTEITPAPAPTNEQLDGLSKQVEGDLANQALTEYTEALKQRLGTSFNEAELKRLSGNNEQ
jgi:peptidyl-prolyl cis-trans isomerase D